MERKPLPKLKDTLVKGRKYLKMPSWKRALFPKHNQVIQLNNKKAESRSNGQVSKWTSLQMDIQIPNGHRKSMPTWLIIKMQIKNIIRYHITQARMASLNRLEKMNAWESVGKRKPSYIVVGSTRLRTELLYDPSIPFQGIYSD